MTMTNLSIFVSSSLMLILLIDLTVDALYVECVRKWVRQCKWRHIHTRTYAHTKCDSLLFIYIYKSSATMCSRWGVIVPSKTIRHQTIEFQFHLLHALTSQQHKTLGWLLFRLYRRLFIVRQSAPNLMFSDFSLAAESRTEKNTEIKLDV